MRVLIVIPGISDKNNALYMQDAINSNRTFKRFVDSKYEKVVHFTYQDILDRHAIVAKTLLDPVRFRFYPKAKAEIITRLETIINFLKIEGHDVDILAHSLGCWISAKAKVQVDRVIHMGSPIGWVGPVGRFFVRQDIASAFWTKPPLTCNKFFNLYSENDFVGKHPVLSDPKWGYGAAIKQEFNTLTKHDGDQYVEFLKEKRYLIW